MKLITIEKNQSGQRLDKYLSKQLPNAGMSFIYKMLRKKNITLNQKKATGKELLKLGDQVSFFFSEETFNKFAGQTEKQNSEVRKFQLTREQIRRFESRILFRNSEVILLNKPAGLLSQKAQETDHSINEELIGFCLATHIISEEEFRTYHPSVCNRLDRNTSGIILAGISLHGSQILSKLIKERQIEKWYTTIVAGNLQGSMKIDGYLKKNKRNNKVEIFQTNVPESSHIMTEYHSLASNGRYTLLAVKLITGKPHQIRAHLAAMGAPIIGDSKYGDSKTNEILKRKYHLHHQVLHARKVVFPAQCELEQLAGRTIVAPYPEQMQKIMEELSLWEPGSQEG